MSKQVTVVPVQLYDRPDGGLRVTSEVLPGLILAGPVKDQVVACIGPAITALFQHRGFTVTSVRASQPITSVMKQPSPRNVDWHVDHHQFVVEFLNAA